MLARERIGSVIAGRYRLDELLGEGGMGAVFKATHVTVGKRFAVKLLHASISKHPDARRRFTQEAQAAAKIGHPAILDVYDLGESDDLLYMVMELLVGESLAERVARGGLPVSDALAYAVGILHALEAAHGAGIIHRDIKPANVFLVDGSSGTAAVRVLDFGIAKFQEAAEGAQTSTGAVVGSAYYMAPEQVRAEGAIDARADVWAVGATLYELLVGEPAHLAPTHAAVIAKIVMKPAPPVSEKRPDVEPAVDRLVATALAIDPDKRFPSARAMREAIERLLIERAGTVISVPPPPLSDAEKRERLEIASSDAAQTPGAVISSPTDLGDLDGSADRKSRSGWLVPLALGALALGALGAFALRSPSPARSPGTGATAARGPVASTTRPEPTVTASPSPSPSSVAAVAVPSASASAAAAPAPAVSASSARRRPTAPAAPAGPCAAGEVLSNGHCCAAGFLWSSGHCERDIAVTAPF